jgi:D-xylose transport system ATP-binding protein
MSEVVLELVTVTKEFPGVRALDGVSFDLRRGEIHALCGENGAGKSTLMKVLSGVHPTGSYGGEIRLQGTPVHFKSLHAAEEHGIALIAQELALVPELSVAENLLLGRLPRRAGFVDWGAVRREAKRALELVGLEVDPARPVKELGIGQQQMVEIAKALAKDASILVLDEPTAALTEADARRLLAFLRELRGRGVSMIYISHRLEEVFEIADRVTVLRDGKSVATRDAASLSRDQVIAMMVGREVKDLYPRLHAQPGAVLLRVAGFSVEDPANPGRRVIDDVSFEVREREVLGIAGLMGAGRTALLSSLFGAPRSAVSGTVEIQGRASSAPCAGPGVAIAAGLALVSEDRKRYGLVPEASVLENVTLATLRRFVARGFLRQSLRDDAAREQYDALGVRGAGLSSLVKQLSGGNQQKVVLGKWLLTRPRVLFLDEPTRGIDVGAKAEIYALINRLAASGLGVVLVSSDLPELLGLSHRVVVLALGRKTAMLEAGDATPERVMAAATRSVA